MIVGVDTNGPAKVEAVEFRIQRPARIGPRGIDIGTDPLGA
jgi:hypothetical protein